MQNLCTPYKQMVDYAIFHSGEADTETLEFSLLGELSGIKCVRKLLYGFTIRVNSVRSVYIECACHGPAACTGQTANYFPQMATIKTVPFIVWRLQYKKRHI